MYIWMTLSKAQEEHKAKLREHKRATIDDVKKPWPKVIFVSFLNALYQFLERLNFSPLRLHSFLGRDLKLCAKSSDL